MVELLQRAGEYPVLCCMPSHVDKSSYSVSVSKTTLSLSLSLSLSLIVANV